MPTIHPDTTIEVWRVVHLITTPTGRRGCKIHVCTKKASEVFGIKAETQVIYHTNLGPNDSIIACMTDVSHDFEDNELMTNEEFQKRTATIPELSSEEYQNWLDIIEKEIAELVARYA